VPITAHYYVIAYDISDQRNRRRALQQLRQYSFGYQNSVFEAQLLLRNKEALCQELESLLDPATDRLLCARLDRDSLCDQLGTGTMTPLKKFLLIN